MPEDGQETVVAIQIGLEPHIPAGFRPPTMQLQIKLQAAMHPPRSVPATFPSTKSIRPNRSTTTPRCDLRVDKTPGSTLGENVAITARRLNDNCERTSRCTSCGEEIRKWRDGPLGVAGVQRGEDQMARLGGAIAGSGRSRRRGPRLPGSRPGLVQAGLQALGKRQHVQADFPLGHDGTRGGGKTYSIGSSMVMMRYPPSSFSRLTIIANEVVLPEPATPQKRTSPLR